MPSAPGAPLGFQGPDANTFGQGAFPADPTIAAGPTHILTAVNAAVSIYTKTGTCALSTSLSTWFANVCPSCTNTVDPRIVYDSLNGRWIMVAQRAVAPSTSKILLSVSQTNNPTGSWWNWALEGNLLFGVNTRADFPDVGFDNLTGAQNGAIYITTNQHRYTSPFEFEVAMLYILPKSAIYAGSGFTCWRAWNPQNPDDNSKAFGLRPARMYGAGNPVDPKEYLLNTFEDGGGSVTAWKVVPTYPPTAVNWTTAVAFPPVIGTYAPHDTVPQATCAQTLASGDNSLYEAIWRNNKLYTAFTADKSFPTGNTAAVRYVIFDTAANFSSVKRTHSLEGSHYFYPSITSDASGNVYVVHARSAGGAAPGGYASIWATGELTTDSVPQPAAPVCPLKTGPV
jgi:hypothetical protein